MHLYRTYSEIGDAEFGIVSLATEQEVLRLEISVDDTLVVQVLDSTGNCPYDLSSISAKPVSCHQRGTLIPHRRQEDEHAPLVIVSLAADPVKELSTGTQVKDQVQVVSRLKMVDETTNVGMSGRDSLENGNLVSDLSDGDHERVLIRVQIRFDRREDRCRIATISRNR